MPFDQAMAIGQGLGQLAWHIAPFRKRVAAVNLRLCFPDWTPAARQKLLRQHYEAMGMAIAELAFAWFPSASSQEALLPRARVEGLEHLDAARAAGQGVLLLTAHFTTLELNAWVLNQHRKFSALYRPPNHPVFARVMTERRAVQMERIVPLEDTRGLFKALRQGHQVWYAPDQGRKIKESALVPFFGEPARTNTATGRIAQLGRAQVIPFFARRTPKNGYKITIQPPLENFPTEDPLADTARVNQLIEQAIRAAPEQYFWLHKRFKKRGEALPDPYA